MQSKIKVEIEKSYLGPWNQYIVDTNFLKLITEKDNQMAEMTEDGWDAFSIRESVTQLLAA